MTRLLYSYTRIPQAHYLGTYLGSWQLNYGLRLFSVVDRIAQPTALIPPSCRSTSPQYLVVDIKHLLWYERPSRYCAHV